MKKHQVKSNGKGGESIKKMATKNEKIMKATEKLVKLSFDCMGHQNRLWSGYFLKKLIDQSLFRTGSSDFCRFFCYLCRSTLAILHPILILHDRRGWGILPDELRSHQFFLTHRVDLVLYLEYMDGT